MKIGERELTHGLFLAPMAGFTDRAHRTVCREMGAEWLTTEMVSAKALCYQDRKTAPLARVEAWETPCAVQLFGHEPDVMAEAARRIEAGVCGGVIPAAIDINMGCPVHKIVSNGDGSRLMQTPELAGRIVRAVRDAVRLPVTVKIRTGWDADHRNAPELARVLEAAGADLICVHGRTRAQGYSGRADWLTIAAVRAAVRIPVVANGDIRDADSALRAKEITGCDGLAIGRGSVGNPFVFREIAAALDGRVWTPPTPQQRYDTAVRQLDLAVQDKGETVAVLEARRQLGGYLSGIRGATDARIALNGATEVDRIREILYTFVLIPGGGH